MYITIPTYVSELRKTNPVLQLWQLWYMTYINRYKYQISRLINITISEYNVWFIIKVQYTVWNVLILWNILEIEYS